MDRSDWESRWQEGRLGFHQSSVSGFLATYADQVWGEGSKGRVYVPLCGKSLDLVFLAERFDHVLGVEYVEQAVQEFFDERGLSPSVESDPLRRYEADDYTLFAADFFNVGSNDLGPIDAVFDRAALVALDAEARRNYANHLRSLLSPGGAMLLITFDYDQSEMSGPPFAVSAEEVNRLYQESFEIKHLETREIIDKGFRDRGLSAMTESAFSLVRR